MKKILFASLAVLLVSLVSCTHNSDEQVLVRFQSTLDRDISDARYTFGLDHQTSLGTLAAGTTTDYIPFDYFETGDALPMGGLDGYLGDSAFFAFSGLWCGTGVNFSQLEPGMYTLVITKLGSGNEVFYQLKFAE